MNLPTVDVASIEVTPPSQTITLTGDKLSMLSGMTTFTAVGRKADGTTVDVSGMVSWTIDPIASITRGEVRVRAPGVYRITASARTAGGVVTSGADLIAQFNGRIPAEMPAGQTPTAADMEKLDGTPSGDKVSIAYPLNAAIFPSNFGPITVHVARPGSQDLARLSWENQGLTLHYYARCETGQPGNGCYITLPLDFASVLVPASGRENVRLTVRLASSSGGGLVESNTIELAWANVPLSGGLYFWTTIPCQTGGQVCAVAGYRSPDPADPRGTAIMRYDFGNANLAVPTESKPTLIYTDQGFPNATPSGMAAFAGSPPAASGQEGGVSWGEGRCIGCHAISFDGTLMAFSIGGSYASSFGMLEIATSSLFTLDASIAPTATGIEALKKYRRGNFATFMTFGPKAMPTDPVLMVKMHRGKLALHQADPSLALVRDNLFSNTTERKTDPFWSPLGELFAFTSYSPEQDAQPSRNNGDTKTGGQIWIASADPMTGPKEDARVLIPREAGKTSYYPAINHDSTLVAFNKSSTSGPSTMNGYGDAPGDGYDDITASLWVTTPTGGTPSELKRANGNTNYANSWPRWSPDSGGFRGQKLYWLAFSSRRPYGLQVNVPNVAGMTAKPQLWFTAVVVGGEFTNDPSYAPVWLPNQNLNQAQPTGNHVPQWVKFAVPIE